MLLELLSAFLHNNRIICISQAVDLNTNVSFFFFWCRTLVSLLALYSMDNIKCSFLCFSEYRGGITDVTVVYNAYVKILIHV